MLPTSPGRLRSHPDVILLRMKASGLAQTQDDVSQIKVLYISDMR